MGRPAPELPSSARDELVDLMQSILRFDTTNPPGNETAAARYLQSKLAEADIDDCTVLESAPGRGNVLARLPASAPGGASRRPLLLLCHLDVVPADAASWRHGPFAGEVADGQVWGRGALDMKNFVAVWTALVLWARRLRLPSDRDIVLAATADEEVGGALGARWLAENHPDWVDAEIAFNEGVLGPFTLNGVTYCPVQVAEKAGAPIELVARGTPGHASIPLPDNPLVQLGRALIAIGEAPLPLHRTGPTSAFLRGLAESQPPEVGRALLALLEAGADTAALARALPEGHLRNLVGALLANTASPTIAEAGVKSNVIPERAVAHLDCRILPGQTGESVLAEVAARLREAGLGEAVQARLLGVGVGPTESPVDPALFDALQAALDRRPSGGRAVPFCSAAATDSRFLRQRGTAAYGLFPGLPDMPEETIHGIDERISLASLQRCLEVMWDVVAALCIPA